MASAVQWTEQPVFPLTDVPAGNTRMVLTPALRWRVVLEQTRHVEHDVIQEAVLRLHAAGEQTADRIADRLQLPEELIRHLLAQRVDQRWTVTGNGRVQATATTVAWVYRDLATSELWPDPAPEQSPLPVQFTGPLTAKFRHGAAGSSKTIQCRLLETRHISAGTPTSLELARFSRTSNDVNRRTAVVSEPEHCLVASPVLGVGHSYAIQTSRKAPHVSLTRELTRASVENPRWRTWLEQVPMDRNVIAGESPLRASVRELQDSLADPARTLNGLLSRIEIALGRYVDAYLYAFVPVSGDAPRERAEELADKIGRLLVTRVRSPASPQLPALRDCRDRWEGAVEAGADVRVLGRLSMDMVALCTALLEMTEDDDG
jgi:hypothetical protein